jgi:group I intron endonuclease
MENKMYIIYKTTNRVNKKTYIGQHKENGRDYLGSGKLIKQAIDKYGRDNFIRETIDTADNKKDIDEKEIYWIKNLNPYYNITEGGTGGDMFTDNPNKEQIRKNYSMAKRGVAKSEEHKQKIRDSVKKYWEENKGKDIRKSWGHKHTEETKKLLSKKSSIAMKAVWKRRKQNEN